MSTTANQATRSTGLDERMAFATELIMEAGALAKSHFVRVSEIAFETKGVQDLVSVADIEVEHHMINRIQAQFPEDAILGEEGGLSGGGETLWVLDPIDGTQVFSLGIASWCVVVALVVRGVTELALVFDPNSGELFSAQRGAGARLNGMPISCAPDPRIAHGLVSIGYPKRMSPRDVLPALGRLLDAGGMFHRNGSGALSLSYVAAGRLLGYAEMRMHSWDCLAGLLLVREAGGRTSGFGSGENLQERSRVVAAPHGIYEELNKILGD